MEIEKQVTLDLLATNEPPLSSTNDMPVIETKPDATPVKEVKEEVVPAAKEEEKSATPDKPDDSSATPEPKKSQGVQKRIDELTRQREDERRAREAAEARELRILAALERATGVGKEEKTVDTEPVKPQPAGFSNPEAYDEALQNWISEKAAYIADRKVSQRLEEERKNTLQETLAAQQRKVQEDFQKRVEKTKEKYPDYSTFAESPEINVSFPMAYAILNSDQGPEIQYYLGRNPEEAKRISSINITDQNGQVVPDVARQLVELGMITAKISTPAAPPKPVSAAPSPIKPISKASEAVKTAEEESMEEYAARRKKELNAVRPGMRH